jgi:hypothetical protein
MPERHRRFLRSCSGLLALTLVAALGDPHVLLALRSPHAHTAPVTAPAAETDPRRRALRDRVRGRCPRPRRHGAGIIPHPRCSYD